MDNYEYTELLKKLTQKLENIKNILKPDVINIRLKEIEVLEAGENFWNDVENATKIGKEKNQLLSKLAKFSKAHEKLTDAVDWRQG